MVHASESQHWYARDGSPAYEIRGANGNMRPATLRDARKIGLVPSVTTIIGCCHKPGLERWKLNEMLHAALTLPKIDGEPEAAWIDRVWADSKETAKKAAERGTALHAAIQGYYETGGGDSDTFPYVRGAVRAVDEWLNSAPWKAERSFASTLGFGGKVDLSCDIAALDFKTKEFGPEDDLKTWDEHAMQLAAYRVGLGMPRARCAIAYVSVTTPGLCRVIEIPQDELDAGWRMFTGLLIYWAAKNKFNPAWIPEPSPVAARMVA